MNLTDKENSELFLSKLNDVTGNEGLVVLVVSAYPSYSTHVPGGVEQ